MKRGKKIILGISLGFFLCISALVGIIFYYYTHPSAVKALAETALSQATGASVAIRGLSYSLHPSHILMDGLIVSSGSEGTGSYLEVPRLHAEISLEGPLGGKTLVIRLLEIKGISGHISPNISLPDTQGPRTPSFLNSLLKKAFASLVFKDIRLERATISEGSLLLQLKEQTLQLSAIQSQLNADYRIEISCGARLEWPSRDMHLQAPRVEIKTDAPISLNNTRIGLWVSLSDVQVQSPFADLNNLQGATRLRYWPDRGEVTFEAMNLSLEAADIREDGEKKTVQLDLHVTADGALRLKDRQWTARSLHLTMGERLQFEGELDAAMKPRQKIDLKVSACRVIPQDLIPLLPVGLRKKTDPAKVKGPIYLTGRIGGIEEGIRWAWDADLEARMEQNPVSFATEDLTLIGTLTGSIEARGQIPDMEVSSDLKAKNILFRGKGIETKPSEAAIAFSGRYPVFDLKDLSARIPQVTARFQERAIQVKDIHLEGGKGRVNAATRTGSLPEIRFESSLLKNITASLDAAEGTIKRVEIQGKETGLAGLAQGLDLLPSGWRLAGQDKVQVRVRCDGGKGMEVTSELVFQDLAFQNPDGSFVGENLSVRATAKAKADPLIYGLSADIAVDVDGGETLYDRFYVDLEKYPLVSHCTGKYNMKGKDLQLSDLRLALKDILTCHLNGRIFEKDLAWQADLNGQVTEIPLKPLFDVFVVEPFQAEKPIVRTLHVGGTVFADVNLAGNLSAWAMKGSVQWDHGHLSAEDHGVSLRGIRLALPLWIRNHETADTVKELDGALSIDSLTVPFIPEQGLIFPLRAGPNQWSVVSPTVVNIQGGDVRLGPMAIQGLEGSMPSIHTALSMDRVDMGPLLSPFWPRPIEGILSGSLDPLSVEGGNLSSRGALTARIFEGELIFSNPGVSGLFAGTPVFKLDARWKDLNLSELTAETSFGKIEGVLNGYAKGLEIAQGQVQKFDLLVETVPKKGTPQRISVKAVDNISRIGGGQSPFVGVAGMFASVFKEFPYEKIGVHATLENDVFRINGTIKEGDTEYLVKRGLLSGVNVVNQNPDNRVSFKDMLKRLHRIKTSRSSPVID